MPETELGVNLPWLRYGQDFGCSAWRPLGGVAQTDLHDAMLRALETVARSGVKLVRWWLLGDGRAGLREDAAGVIEGLDQRFFADADSAVEGLRAHGLRAVFVVSDFLWFAAPRLVDGVQLGGRRESVRHPERRAALLESVFAPIAARYGSEPAIAAWDLFNEPEWATLALGTLDPRHSLSRREMRRFLADLAATFRPRVRQPLTVGLGRSRSLPLVRGLDLDFYQVHWYESQEPLAILAQPVAARGLDRPLMLGEFPTRGASLPPDALVDIASRAGYSAALAWSLLAEDEATDGGACESCLVAWNAGAGDGTPA